MPASLRFVDPTPKPGWLRRAFCVLANTRLSLFLSRHISWHLDPVLLKLTRGRFATTLMIPTEVLETRGARTGATRRNAIIYFHDVAVGSDRVIIAASNAGRPHHPAWYHNLVAHPDVTFGGVPMRATVVDPAEAERLWDLADRVFPAYAPYRRRAAGTGRQIPLIALTPKSRATERAQ
jgi:deazaflavin-dependent oxidoreductase (nitroreductase family)